MTQQSGRIWVMGGRPLNGTAAIPAAKNSVLPLLAAALLCRGPVRRRAVPRLSDVECSLGLLRGAGCAAHWQGADIVVAGMPSNSTLPGETAAQMRASILFCAPLLARLGRAETSLPGGCNIGARPIDLHLEGLARMGAKELDAGAGKLVLAAPGGLHGTDFTLRFPSVGATETLLLAAACARGTTVLRGAAREPEIVDLQDFLCACGAEVRGAGGSVITVEGKRPLHGCSHRVIADRIVAATYLCAGAAAGGDILLRQADCRHLATVTTALQQAGCRIDCGEEDIRLRSEGRLQAVTPVRTAPYPGFPTDCQAILMAALLRSRGTTVFVENIFESRYRHVAELQRMGADIRVEGRVAVVCGVERLHGADVLSADLRGGAALVIAALQAEGQSSIHRTHHIQRGYADLTGDLARLGARIRADGK